MNEKTYNEYIEAYNQNLKKFICDLCGFAMYLNPEMEAIDFVDCKSCLCQGFFVEKETECLCMNQDRCVLPGPNPTVAAPDASYPCT
ncbi:MAG: hypothetical protein GY874_15885 [Desulfobacteraceae bacterium]|nr:hypothetical protein [Desulfobacteraceae bacterium]